MEIEKTLAIAAPADKVWSLLLDPQVMAGCVPGMQSIEVVSPTEYSAVMTVKLSFISAKFRIKTTIVEQRPPTYLRCEGTGDDASVASSMKQQTELFLAAMPDGSTEMRLKVKVDVLGRLGNFGLSAMKTKADRLWEEFGHNLRQRIEGDASVSPSADADTIEESLSMPQHESAPVLRNDTTSAAPTATSAPLNGPRPSPAAPATPATGKLATSVTPAPSQPGWLSRLLGGSSSRGALVDANRAIRIEIQREGTLVVIHWPVEAADKCAALLRDCLR
ncbi:MULTISPECIES: CoxG family protein [unclassified Variovorax]|uniref:CoxG family protein n=1 Tax=unclassified Variovorax TaxID=663243 RepID=UPI001BD5253F|nr:MULTISPECIES: SRPBCC family protein [unclassified Variovorax]